MSTMSRRRILRTRPPGVGHLRAPTGAISSHTILNHLRFRLRSGPVQISSNRVSLQRFSVANLKGQGFITAGFWWCCISGPEPRVRPAQDAGRKVPLALIKERSGDSLADPMRIGDLEGTHHRGWGWVVPRRDSKHPNVPAPVAAKTWEIGRPKWCHHCMGVSVLACSSPRGKRVALPKALPGVKRIEPAQT